VVQPLSDIPEEEDPEVSMGETDETDEATILLERVVQTMSDVLQNHQVIIQ
jgi:hypothetical protein